MTKKNLISLNRSSSEKKSYGLLLWDIIDYSKYSPEHVNFLIDRIFPSIKSIYENENALMPNTWGDASIAFFPTAIQTADTALKIRNLVLQEHLDDFRVRMRIAIHFGIISEYYNPIIERRTVFGNNVNFVARVEPVVSPNSVWATQTFIDMLKGSSGHNIEYDEVGERELVKGWGVAKLYQLRYQEEARFISRPILTSTSNYDKTILQVNDYLDWIIKNQRCDIITLYVRDELARNEFNIEACKGLSDPSPMYGHIVYDDFRLRLMRDTEDEAFEASLQSETSENPNGFRAREQVISRAYFRLKDPIGCKAELFFNWRTSQPFGLQQRDELRTFKNEIFKVISAIQGISEKRAITVGKELRARRWLDYNRLRSDSIEAKTRAMIDALKEFFRRSFEHDLLHIKIILNQDGELRIIDEETTPAAYFPSPLSINDDISCKWVYETTRPLYLDCTSNKAKQVSADMPMCRLIVPIRVPPNIKESVGVISMECSREGILKPEMVKSLCSLGDHFGLIVGSHQ